MSVKRVIYEVNIEVDAAAHDEYRLWLRDHIAEILALPGFAGAKLFVFPSEIEAMSMMLLEVISCGVPVLASDIAENTEVTGESYPWLFRNADPAQLAEKLSRFLQQGPGPELAALRERCARDFNWTAIALRYLALYRHIAGCA